MRTFRALLFAAASATGLLVGCTVGTEGAACGDDTHCPAGQRCGHDRTCSLAAMACQGTICHGASCDGKDLKSCQVAGDGICAALVDVATCSEHQACNPDAVTCDCVSGGCTPGVESFCSGTGQLVTCATEAGSSCRYEERHDDCPTFTECQPDGLLAARCGCPASDLCPGEGAYGGTGEGAYCPADPAKKGVCAFTNGCRHPTGEVACAAGATCGGAYPAAACACPLPGPNEGQGCDPLAAATACKDGSTLLSCRPKVSGSDCHVWRDPEDCTLGTLVCSATGSASGTPACACAEDACGGAAGSFCSAGQEVSCVFSAANGCWSEGPATACGAGESCTGTQPAGACCPNAGPGPGDGCATAGAFSCSGDDLLRCAPQPADARCLAWSLEEACGASQLLCTPGAPAACTCPPVATSPATYYVDSGAPRKAGLEVNGAEAPHCRFTTVAAALRGPALGGPAVAGDTVKATGFASAPVEFTEEALVVPAGVTLTTSELPLGTASYVLQPAAGVGTGTFITLGPGATLSGFQVRNTTATGVGVATGCPLAGDTAQATVDTVRISGLGTGATPVRFANGLRHTGNCSLAVRDSTIEEADRAGVFIDSPASATSLDLSGNLIQRNQGNGPTYTIVPYPARKGGGLVFNGTLPSAVTFGRNKVLSNVGDQVLVFSSGTLDLSGSVCDANSNTIACYTTGVGLAVKAGVVNVGFTVWGSDVPTTPVDYLFQAGATVDGMTNTCVKFAGPCP
ncbi:MAG: hypothetical protein IPO09_05420 [Anaeromyxobacter sp.]|nr:hypothetical protein [Anaeromyxobacter sp.]